MFPLLLFLVAKPTQKIHDVISYVQPVCALVTCLIPESQTPDPNNLHSLGFNAARVWGVQPELWRHTWMHRHPVASSLVHRWDDTDGIAPHPSRLAAPAWACTFPSTVKLKKNEILVSRGDSSSGLWVLCRCSSFLPQTKNMHYFFILLLVLSKERLG